MPEISPSKWLVQAGWDDVPHLDEATKAEMLEATPPHLRPARSKGEPSMGAGAIYPIVWEEVTCKPFAIPDYWPRAYALDVGWRWTGVLWQAWDPGSGQSYVYAEYKRGKQLPLVHAAAIKARGAWIPGLIDPAARQRNQIDGRNLFNSYRSNGLLLRPANTKDVESGIHDVWTDLSIGSLKFFSTLEQLKSEYVLYRRDEDGNIVKEHDHLLDDLRMLRRNGRQRAETRPIPGGRDLASRAVADPSVGY